jgi:hypothetical protein
MFVPACWKWSAAILLAAGLPVFAAPPPATNANGLGDFLAQHGYAPMRVDNNGHNQDIVRVSLNGYAASLGVDTGCSRTCITDALARNLKLTIQNTVTVTGVGGKVPGTGFAVLTSFTLNNNPINRLNTIEVLPPNAKVPVDGLLGYDTMRLNAVILPVGEGYFLYKPGPAAPPDIDSYLKASGYQPIPLTFGEGGLRAAGSLNGHPLVALVDCGANYTLFDSDFVKMTVGALVSRSRLVSWGLDGRPMQVETFRAFNLKLGALTLPPTLTTTASGTTLRAVHAQALLGYDLLAEHRAIIDLGHNVLWMK